MAAQSDLCQTWSETPKTVFFTTRLLCVSLPFYIQNLSSLASGAVQAYLVLPSVVKTPRAKGLMACLKCETFSQDSDVDADTADKPHCKRTHFLDM